MVPDAILFDFDGVIIDSMHIRDLGYREIVKGFPSDIVDQFIQYHRINSGLSRYVKFRYFYENLLGEQISEEKVYQLAEQFSVIMKSKLTDPSMIIDETLSFVNRYHEKIPAHIVSGSDQNELRYICQRINIEHYFMTIEGSPTSKIDLVSGIISHYKYSAGNTILIGDSINDYDAAKENKVIFYAYNNDALRKHCHKYIDSFDEVIFNV
jgi:phosphoglycolate phosphatase-like HAD superfamily hydrolase